MRQYSALLSALFAPVLVVACSQNPHVLSGPDRRATPPAPVTTGDPGDPGDPGNWGKDGKDGQDYGKVCHETMVTRVFESREPLAGEASDSRVPALAMEVRLPPPSMLREIQAVSLRYSHDGDPRSAGDAPTAVCLRERGSCRATVAAQAEDTLDLLTAMDPEEFALTVYAHPVLHWEAAGEVGLKRATLTVRTRELHCVFDPAPMVTPTGKPPGKPTDLPSVAGDEGKPRA
jgi:hypothetical protein